MCSKCLERAIKLWICGWDTQCDTQVKFARKYEADVGNGDTDRYFAAALWLAAGRRSLCIRRKNQQHITTNRFSSVLRHTTVDVFALYMFASDMLYFMSYVGWVRCAVLVAPFHTTVHIFERSEYVLYFVHITYQPQQPLHVFEWGKWRTFSNSNRSAICCSCAMWSAVCIYLNKSRRTARHQSVDKPMRAPVWVCSADVRRHYRIKIETSVCLNCGRKLPPCKLYFKLEKYSTASIVG